MAQAPSLERVQELLVLDVETGVLRWRKTLGSRALAGDVAGYPHKASGYWIIGIDGVRRRAHVLIWFMLYGEWCPRLIDHEDRDRGNNRPSNLRKASESQQRMNAALRSDNTSGERGVHWQAGAYVARARVDGVEHYAGRHKTVEEAAEAARKMRLKLFGEFVPAYDLRG